MHICDIPRQKTNIIPPRNCHITAFKVLHLLTSGKSEVYM